MTTTTALQTEAIRLQAGDKVILDDMTLSFCGGQFHGVLGPNGAGKTSLLKILTGQRQSEGKVIWQGQHLKTLSPQALARQIAVVNQVNDTVFALTSRQVVTMGLLPHKHLLSRYTKADMQVVDCALNDVGLSDKRDQFFSELSGGEQQRCLIARALVQGASLLVLDEPVNHLDVYYQHQVLHLLHSLCQQHGKTVIVSLHDLNLAAAYCDHVVLLNNGKAIATGTPEQVLEAERLSATFRIPCTVHKGHSPGSARVEFMPQNTEHQWRQHSGQSHEV